MSPWLHTWRCLPYVIHTFKCVQVSGFDICLDTICPVFVSDLPELTCNLTWVVSGVGHLSVTCKDTERLVYWLFAPNLSFCVVQWRRLKNIQRSTCLCLNDGDVSRLDLKKLKKNLDIVKNNKMSRIIHYHIQIVDVLSIGQGLFQVLVQGPHTWLDVKWGGPVQS